MFLHWYVSLSHSGRGGFTEYFPAERRELLRLSPITGQSASEKQNCLAWRLFPVRQDKRVSMISTYLPCNEKSYIYVMLHRLFSMLQLSTMLLSTNTKISLCLRTVFSGPSFSTYRIAKDPKFHQTDQTGRNPRLI